MGVNNAQALANIAWAFATANQAEELLFAALAMTPEQRMGEHNAQALANIAWAFAKGTRQTCRCLQRLQGQRSNAWTSSRRRISPRRPGQ